MKNNFFKIRYSAMILIAAGYGWAAGRYIPDQSPLLLYLLQFIIIAALLIMGAGFLSPRESDDNKNSRSAIAVSILLIISLIVDIFDILHGHTSSATYFDTHHNFTSLAPLVLLLAGNGLWVTSLIQGFRNNTSAKQLFKSQYTIL